MKKYIAFFIVGFLFGILLIVSEVASWFRIYEMFQFKSFHMYGVIGSAVLVGFALVQLVKRKELKTFDGSSITIKPKEKGITNYLIGGTIFGLGWALAGACPGPMYALLGSGFVSIFVLLFGALLGTFVYGVLKSKLPH
ncbi:DUF6691 family protein [Lacinutrix sp.]|uniref:DUF6691 family protein n=1 Tax=Lacinutrix sp. TaxID=1937692 RepID=UPI0026071B08|nr:DUF6691 family protein [Lacinutrix sp.]MDG1714899.1 YeeE/YedE thiosulfate transporter family protein [Lacinutrix sp.]